MQRMRRRLRHSTRADEQTRKIHQRNRQSTGVMYAGRTILCETAPWLGPPILEIRTTRFSVRSRFALKRLLATKNPCDLPKYKDNLKILPGHRDMATNLLLRPTILARVA